MNAATDNKASGRELAGFALVDPGLMGLSLFRPLPRRGRNEARKRMFEMDTVHGGRKLRVVGAYTLGADDLSVLLAVMALAGLLGKTIEAAASETSRVDIVDGLESEGEVVEATHMRVRTTLYTLCHEAGLSVTGDAYDRISESLRRLRAVHYDDLGPVGGNSRRLRAGGKQNLLSAKAEEGTGEILVVINARFAAVLLGAQFIRVDLVESRHLGEMARLLHLRLSAMVRQGRGLTVPTDQLCEWVYGAPSTSDRERRRRREEVRQGMTELGAVAGWSVTENRRRMLVDVARQAGS